MSTEYDERVLDYWRLPKREYTLKLKQDDGLKWETELKNTMPVPLGSFVLNNSKGFVNNFIREIDGFKTNNVYYTDTESLYIE